MFKSDKPGFTRIPNIIFNCDLTLAEQSVLIALYTFADRKTMDCYPSLETIGERARVHRATVSKALRKLINDFPSFNTI